MTLFQQGFKAEVYFGDELTAHHMSTRSVYRFKANDDVSITHMSVMQNGEWVDQFNVCLYTVTEYHESGNVLSSETKLVESFYNFLDAYYCGVQVVNNLNMDAMVIG